jgi:tRNA(Ile)-lysidine synthase
VARSCRWARVANFVRTVAEGLLDRCRFPGPNSPLACAVSGGADSLALLVLAVKSGCEATAFHVDHGLRRGSELEAAVVERAARYLGCGFVALSVACAPGPNLEARARVARFAALPPGVATGHTADDQAETVLINLLRGAGPDGVGGMRLGSSHPILALRRVETEAVVEEAGLEVVTDPSNIDPAMVRNRIRHELLPLMNAIAGRDVAALLARFAEVTSDDVDLLESLAELIDESSVAALRSAPVPLRRRAVRRLIRAERRTPYPPDFATVARVLAVVDGTAKACDVGGGFRLRRSAGRLYVDGPTCDERGVR